MDRRRNSARGLVRSGQDGTGLDPGFDLARPDRAAARPDGVPREADVARHDPLLTSSLGTRRAAFPDLQAPDHAARLRKAVRCALVVARRRARDAPWPLLAPDP